MRCISIFSALIIGVLLCCACSGSNEQKQKLAEELRMFKEQAIVLPDNLLAKYYGEQEPDISLLDRPIKMVVYVNQGGCEDCKLRELFPVYIFTLENKPFTKFGVVIILNPSHIESVDNFLKEVRFRHTVFYDLDSSFERTNPHFPKNERFHTFLLDENNNVILVGNPTRNVKLKNLYLSELRKRHQ